MPAETPPAHQTAAFDQAHAGYAREIDKLIEAYRDIRDGSTTARELDIAGLAGYLLETPNDRTTFVELLTVAVVRLAEQETPDA